MLRVVVECEGDPINGRLIFGTKANSKSLDLHTGIYQTSKAALLSFLATDLSMQTNSNIP